MIKKMDFYAYDPKFSDTSSLARAIGRMKKMEYLYLSFGQ